MLDSSKSFTAAFAKTWPNGWLDPVAMDRPTGTLQAVDAMKTQRRETTTGVFLITTEKREPVGHCFHNRDAKGQELSFDLRVLQPSQSVSFAYRHGTILSAFFPIR